MPKESVNVVLLADDEATRTAIGLDVPFRPGCLVHDALDARHPRQEFALFERRQERRPELRGQRARVLDARAILPVLVDQAHETLGMGQRKTATRHHPDDFAAQALPGPQVAVAVALQ
jgi:hypothetical protein